MRVFLLPALGQLLTRQNSASFSDTDRGAFPGLKVSFYKAWLLGGAVCGLVISVLSMDDSA